MKLLLNQSLVLLVCFRLLLVFESRSHVVKASLMFAKHAEMTLNSPSSCLCLLKAEIISTCPHAFGLCGAGDGAQGLVHIGLKHTTAKPHPQFCPTC